MTSLHFITRVISIVQQLNSVLSWALFRCTCGSDEMYWAQKREREREKDTETERERCFSNFVFKVFFKEFFM